MKNLLIALVVLVILAGAGWFFFMKGPAEPAPVVPGDQFGGPATGTTTQAEVDETKTKIGTSAGGRDIMAYHYGPSTALKEVVFVGGIHGGYSANTSLVAYDLMADLEKSAGTLPDNVKVTVIPVLNPDGLFKTVGTTERFASSEIPTGDRSSGRFNANGVDLNRNFACDWNAKAVWQSKEVSGGTAEFSEPEAKAIRDYVAGHDIAAVVVYYSAAGGVFGSNCHGDILKATTDLTNEYAKASGYSAHAVFDYYETTGDMTNWLAKEGIPAISVLLASHTDSEWAKNSAGAKAVLEYIGNIGG